MQLVFSFRIFSATGLAGRTRGGAMDRGMAMAQDGITTMVTCHTTDTLASTGDEFLAF